MIYFDNAATGDFKPDSVITAVTSAVKYSANPGRSGHKLSIACLERVYASRKLLCEFWADILTTERCLRKTAPRR